MNHKIQNKTCLKSNSEKTNIENINTILSQDNKRFTIKYCVHELSKPLRQNVLRSDSYRLIDIKV
jgi:hypothetical protein